MVAKVDWEKEGANGDYSRCPAPVVVRREKQHDDSSTSSDSDLEDDSARSSDWKQLCGICPSAAAPLAATPQQELSSARLVRSLSFNTPPPGFELHLERSSVYGAVILLPQLARSAGWPRVLTVHSIRTFVFLAANCVLQTILLKAIAKEQEVFHPYGSEMYLCDFELGDTGPLGTKAIPSRLYADFDQWITRVFVRDSLIATFPDKADIIMERVDPGEYGMESPTCRLACCFLFVMATLEELWLVWHMLRILYKVPTKAESWLIAETDPVKVKVAGMPRLWKGINLLLVWLPKCCLWKLTMQTGFAYLMDEADISNQIVNAVALVFILNIDEQVCSVFFPDELKSLMEQCEGFKMTVDQDHDDDLVQELKRQRVSSFRIWDICKVVPYRLMITFFLLALFTCEYYLRRCKWDGEEKRFVSRTMYVPRGTGYDFWNFILPNWFPLPHGAKPFWRMVNETKR